MSTRQAKLYILCFFIFAELSACATAETPVAPPTLPVPTITATSVPLPTATATPLTCLTEPGRVDQGVVQTTNPPQEFLIYLPPCYEFSTERYPALYLLHGQTYKQDQWLRIGAAKAADELIHTGQAAPFIMIFPDDRYWNVPAGSSFGIRLIYDLIPYVDANYRTRTEKKFRALGGLSRGSGWTAKLGFERPDLFGALGLHSPALFKDNAPYLERIIKDIPEEEHPKLWIDIGEADTELGSAILLEQMLSNINYVHEFHRFTGDHTENYWGKHVKMYLGWYASIWREYSVDAALAP